MNIQHAKILISLQHSTFVANNGSALLLQLSLAYLEGHLLFENNTANLGAAISVQDRSRVSIHKSCVDCVSGMVFMDCIHKTAAISVS